uniref:Uncharacterized protein n=1 Tax=Anguilla anguilla TaxID=7936 RepID=A0A0E9W9K5_ANGAN
MTLCTCATCVRCNLPHSAVDRSTLQMCPFIL